ncbi:MAG: hypothetical protein ACRD0Z_17265 [Acidimicrobiales bacterium]
MTAATGLLAIAVVVAVGLSREGAAHRPALQAPGSRAPGSRDRVAAGQGRAAGDQHTGATLTAQLLESATAVTASTHLPADCVPQAVGPPGSTYQLGLVGTVTNGTLTAGPATVADITAKFCGIVTVVSGEPPCYATGMVSSPADGEVFGSLSATLTLVPGMTPKVPFAAHPGTITGGFSCHSSNDGLEVDLSATVSATTGLYGLSCEIGPLTIPLTGVLTGPLTATQITLSSDDFSVPAVSSSPTCEGAVPANLDAIAGLPIKPGGARVNLPAKATLYRPAN